MSEDEQPVARPLGELIAAVRGASTRLDARLSGLMISGIANHSAAVERGTLFVAVPGHAADGGDYVDQAVERGAVAIMAETAVTAPGHVAIVRVPDARRALAELAASWHHDPARRLSLVGITGTVGKTSVLAMLEAILRRAGRPIGTIGSLGVGIGGEQEPTGHTAPDALVLYEALARIADAGLGVAAMEVTSHALMQRRVEGLRFDLGVLLNLVPFEHVDYHRTFRGYIDAKLRYFDHLDEGTPLIYNADDRAVRGVVRGRALRLVSCGTSRTAHVRIERVQSSVAGTSFDLNVRRPVEGLDGRVVQPIRVPLQMRLLGRSNATNATLAATAGLCLGAGRDAVRDALREMPAPKRRMELLRVGSITVLDDTVGHPDSLSMVFEVLPALAMKRLHMVFGIRGSRGRRINRRLGETLAVWADATPLDTLVVTTCDDTADERNRVTPAERAAFVSALDAAGIRHQIEPLCEAAIGAVMRRASAGDLVMLLGAQGMDRAAELARSAAAPPSV